MSYQNYVEYCNEIKKLNGIAALLSWDMEVKMPKRSDRSFRADQSAMIQGLIHEKQTSSTFENSIEDALNDRDLSEDQLKCLEISSKDILQSKKLSKEFIEKESKRTSNAYSVWEEAKMKSNFGIFQNDLEKIVELQQEKAACYGYEGHPYNALLDLYEEGSTVSQLDKMFLDVKSKLGSLIQDVLAVQGPKTNYLTQKFEITNQIALNKDILGILAVNTDFCRIDESSHPFCTSFHPSDIRMTTRYSENDIMSSIWSTIHESGHGRYEMGLQTANSGLPTSSATSLGIHESQSRFWENNIARSQEFINLIFPLLKKYFPSQFQSVQPEVIFREVNFVEPTFIRTESDELTYHHHIMIRYEIEKLLISGDLNVSEVRDYWNDSYKKYLGLEVPNDSKGVLQDVHWSFGGIGYFPTYSLGSFYAAQWYEEINKTQNISEMIKNSQFEDINEWHAKHIHQFGRLKTSDEICQSATNLSLDFGCFERYIRGKFNI